MGKFSLTMAVIVAVAIPLAGCGGSSNPPNYPTGAIEQKYYAPGPWAVTVSLGGGCCDSAGNKFDLYYPTQLGANGFKHPILTWGNGSFGSSNLYAYLLKHMASWGFVVIATQDSQTGVGQTILDGATFLKNANNDLNSPFYQKLNINAVGSFGHSQGATGALNALIKSAGLIKTAVPIEIPAQAWCSSGVNCADASKMTSGSIFLIDGSADGIISPETQPPWVPGQQSVEGYFNAAPNNVVKLKGSLKGPNHNDVQGQPGCTSVPIGCVNGVYGYLGYPTAWFMFQLQGDSYAHGAFINPTGEMFSETKNWERVASNVP
jgi:Chlorophyllase enzyme